MQIRNSSLSFSGTFTQKSAVLNRIKDKRIEEKFRDVFNEAAYLVNSEKVNGNEKVGAGFKVADADDCKIIGFLKVKIGETWANFIEHKK